MWKTLFGHKDILTLHLVAPTLKNEDVRCIYHPVPGQSIIMWISANQWGMALCWVTKKTIMHSVKLLSVNDVTFGSHTMIPEYNAPTGWKELSTKGIDRIWAFINAVVKTTKSPNYFWHLSLRNMCSFNECLC